MDATNSPSRTASAATPTPPTTTHATASTSQQTRYVPPATSYARPENYLEVLVSDPQLRLEPSKHVDFLVSIKTNLKTFAPNSQVRRRYSDFEWLRDALERESTTVVLPPLPGKVFTQKYADKVINARRLGLQRFAQMYFL